MLSSDQSLLFAGSEIHSKVGKKEVSITSCHIMADLSVFICAFTLAALFVAISLSKEASNSELKAELSVSWPAVVER
jgi:hypothetical protein